MSELIFNRTADDVKRAIQIRKDKLQKGLTLTNYDISILDRGCVTYTTLNRIESQQDFLKKELYEMGYMVNTSNRLWGKEDIFYDGDFQRIVENNAKLRDAFYVYSNTPKNAIARYRYDEFNSLECILYDLERMIEYTKSQYRRCGAYNCGEG